MIKECRRSARTTCRSVPLWFPRGAGCDGGVRPAMVAYGVVDLVMDAVVDPAVEIDLPDPATPTPTSGSGG